MARPFPAVLALSLSALAIAAPESHSAKRVALVTSAESWRRSGPFDIGQDITKKLHGAGMVVVSPGEPHDAKVSLIYEETKGRPYRIMQGPSIGNEEFSTEITLNCTVRAAGGEPLLTIRAWGVTPFSFKGTSLYDTALEDLRADGEYREAGRLIAAAIGFRPAFSELLPAAVENRDLRPSVLRLAEERYQANSDTERATLALLRDDLDGCVAIGTPCLDPLTLALQHAPSTAVIRAMVTIGDSRAGGPLLDHLLRLRRDDDFWSMQNRFMVLATVEALGRLGDGSAVDQLESLRTRRLQGWGRRSAEKIKTWSSESEIAAAADEALRSIRERTKR